MKNIVTIGGGIAGIEASNVLANLGYNVTIIEKEKTTGGKLNQWHHLFPDLKPAKDIKDYTEKVLKNENISIKTGAEIDKIEKQNGTFYVYTGNIRYAADALVVSTGYDLFDAERKEEYGYKIYDNVITSADLEKMLIEKNSVTTVEGKAPERIALIHCVGSRDEKSSNHYCSKVCCVTGVKQAIEINKLMPKTQVYCFYMDLRMFDKHFEELYRTAQESHNIQFIRGRVSEVAETIDRKLLLKTEDTLSGRPLKLNVDMIVLLVGMEAGIGTEKIGKLLNLTFENSRFIKTENEHNQANLSSQKGVFLAGTCTSPMSIKETIQNARSAAYEVHKYLLDNG
jgi:heterodisulfide reductase subunit A